MATVISINPEDGPSAVTKIDCGTSSPKLSGTIDVSAFENLQEIRCRSNHITEITGYTDNTNIQTIFVDDNKLSGSIPDITGMSSLQLINYGKNQLTGSIPSLSNNTVLRDFFCYSNQLTGNIPSLSNNTVLEKFNCVDNNLTGNIPSLSSNTVLEQFSCRRNQLSGYVAGSVPTSLLFFKAEYNQLTATAVNAILADLVAAGTTNGTLNLGGTNAAPTGQGSIDAQTLRDRNWSVTVAL